MWPFPIVSNNVAPAGTQYYPEDRFIRISRCEGHRGVFGRLTDSNYYTGAHRQRFDEFGNGRGMAGREYLYLADGMTESATRSHEVYSSVVRRPRKCVVAPGTLGVQKYGVQAVPPRLVWLYRNNDRHHSGASFYVKKHFRSLDAIYIECSKALNLPTGPVRRLYDQNLRPVKRMADLVDGGKYLCTSGEPPAAIGRLEKFLSSWVVHK